MGHKKIKYMIFKICLNAIFKTIKNYIYKNRLHGVRWKYKIQNVRC